MDFPQVSYSEVYTSEELARIEAEFKRGENEIYLDHAGSTLYAQSHIQQYSSTLLSNVFGNPHSRNPSSSLCTDAIDGIRLRILRHFGTNGDDYAVIFTSGATSALRLLADTFTFNGGPFIYMEESHTSVVGMREVVGSAPPCGGTFAVPYQVMANSLKNASERSGDTESADNGRVKNALVAYPAQCNFSGSKYPLDWITSLQKGGLTPQLLKCHAVIPSTPDLPDDLRWYVLLDAAAFVGSNYLDLSKYPADFISISFYKMFGFPTGLGALLVKRKSGAVLQKRYVGGGTVQVLIPSTDFYVAKKELEGKFEDGTIDFLSILSLQSAFDTWLSLGISRNKISSRTFSLCQYAYNVLSQMTHSNGLHLAQIYTLSLFDSKTTSGHILTFNLLRRDGSFIGYSQVEEIAFVNRVHLRYGCFCNPGACRKFLGYEPQDLLSQYAAGHVCGDMRDLIDGKPTGAVRMSVGYMTPKSHVDHFLRLVYSTWIAGESQETVSVQWPVTSPRKPRLTHIFIYPLKSCAPVEILGSWGLTEGGLAYDRQWLIVNSFGIGLNQKRFPGLVRIRPKIFLEKGILQLCATGYEPVSLPLKMTGNEEECYTQRCNSKVCGEKVIGVDCGPAISTWLNSVLGQEGLQLLRALPEHINRLREHGRTLSLANDSHFVLLSLASLRHLATHLESKGVTFWHDDDDSDPPDHKCIRNLIGRFRPNLVVDWSNPYEEESWDEIHLGQVPFKSGGPCTRCGTVCMDQKNGQRSAEPLLSLAARTRGNPRFGIHLYRLPDSESQILSIGDALTVDKHRGMENHFVKECLVKVMSPLEENLDILGSID